MTTQSFKCPLCLKTYDNKFMMIDCMDIHLDERLKVKVEQERPTRSVPRPV